jgi:plastocyanin
MDRIRTLSGRALIGLALAVALAAGCGSSSPSTSTGGAGSNTISQGPNGQLVFSPNTLSVKKGAAVTIKNVGSVAHTFTITGQGIDITNDVGQTHQVTISLAPGTYPFVCRFHEGSGMTGTLTVTS